MNNPNEVIKYLKALQTFCYGDLGNFEDQCLRIEREESIAKSNLTGENQFITASNSAGYSPTLTTQTTVFPDSSNTVEISFEKKEFYRSTIPHTLLLFSAIDIIGFLLGTGNNPSDTTGNFSTFFNNLTLSEQEKLILIKFYRHGMAHSFFPKKKFGVSYFSGNPVGKLFFKEHEIISLNVNFLIKITKKRFESVLENESLHSNMMIQFQKLQSSDDKFIQDKGIDIEAFGKSL